MFGSIKKPPFERLRLLKRGVWKLKKKPVWTPQAIIKIRLRRGSQKLPEVYFFFALCYC